jgi:Bifunctional DNA primase/polymerase, N-terminal
MGPQLDGRECLIALDEDAPDALAELAARHGETVVPTWRQQARRGLHHIYAAGSEVRLRVDLLHGRGGALHLRLPGIDVLGARRYICGAPSTHRDGEHRYTILDDRAPAELPDWLWRLIVAAAAPARVRHSDPELDDAGIDKRWPYASRLYRAERLCETHPPAIQGNRGWPTTMLLVGSIVTGLALGTTDAGRTDAIEIVMRVYSPRCQPPWSQPEIEYMVDRAIAMPYRARGWLLAQSEDGGTSGRGGQSGGLAATAPSPPRARAEIYGVDDRPGRGGVTYRILDGVHAGAIRGRPLAWPPTDRSRRLWDALARAVGLDGLPQLTRPHAQLWQRLVRVDIVDDPSGQYDWRLGDVHPLDAGEPAP